MNNTTTENLKKISKEITDDMYESIKDCDSEPERNIINNILNFSKALKVKKMKDESFVQVVLN